MTDQHTHTDKFTESRVKLEMYESILKDIEAAEYQIEMLKKLHSMINVTPVMPLQIVHDGVISFFCFTVSDLMEFNEYILTRIKNKTKEIELLKIEFSKI
jgi:hypothetical protein